APEAVGLGVVWRSFIHETGGTVCQKPVYDVTMAGHPANVSGAPVNIIVPQIEDEFAGEFCLEQIAPSGVQDSFGFANGTAGVENEERRFAIHAFRRAASIHLLHFLMPPDIPALLHGDIGMGSSEDDDFLNG